MRKCLTKFSRNFECGAVLEKWCSRDSRNRIFKKKGILQFLLVLVDSRAFCTFRAPFSAPQAFHLLIQRSSYFRWWSSVHVCTPFSRLPQAQLMRLESLFFGALCVMSGGRLPAALFMVVLLDSKGAEVRCFQGHACFRIALESHLACLKMPKNA